MRDIKFRALGTKGWKPTENNGWYYGSSDHNDYLGENKKHQYSSLPFFFKNIGGNYFDKETLSQFTGLLDKQGVEIYEGDVVKTQVWTKISDDVSSGDWYVGTIKFHRGSFVAFFEKPEVMEYIQSFRYEVIGNIYEHSHLLDNN